MVAVAVLCVSACGDSVGDVTDSSMCEAMVDKQILCNGIDSADREAYLDSCEAGVASGEEPFGDMSEACRNLFAAIEQCNIENNDCSEPDENSPCADQYVAFADECGR